ncbi:LAME_0H20824g1_1 [Lachancea meyersii CBS 8951]|uniref:LAME_0H20824g1_1 n=1 Tax=Lachancea meyersii CBS 8951 TaxID=1266667 RepID=A0A1G4KJK4_9SACH|nr:LAME_0H20824g1_1 [Lachancea meyersii CBS 8951]
MSNIASRSDQIGDVASPQPTPSRYWTDPRVLSEYLQLIFNAVVVSGVLYLCVRFVQLINRDVDKKLQVQAAAAVRTVVECRNKYVKNRCQPDQRAPWLESQCLYWSRCMNQEVPEATDPQRSAVVWAETLAEIINGFLKPISVKSLSILLISTCGIIIVSNMAFKTYRVSYEPITTSIGRSGLNTAESPRLNN